jgi:hypothetical protein
MPGSRWTVAHDRFLDFGCDGHTRTHGWSVTRSHNCRPNSAVVRRSYYQGLTTAQIAAGLGVAESTVKSQLHHALRSLRQTLQEMGVTQ